jgi:hypothetical protein
MEAAYQEEMAIQRAQEKREKALNISKSILEDLVSEAMTISDNYWELFTPVASTSEKTMTSEDLWNMLQK